MAYSFTTNLVPASMAEVFFNLKALLKTAGWSVLSSSDGSTYNAAGDQITVAGTGAGGLNNTNAWFRIRSPAGAGGKEFCFQNTAGTVANSSWRVKYSYTAGFSGGTPGISRVPSATDEAVITGSGTDAAPTGTLQGTSVTWSSHRFQLAADANTPYAFWVGGYPSGGGVHGSSNGPIFIHDPMASGTGHPSDLDPTIIVWQTGVSGSNASTVRTANNSAFGWFKKGLAGETFSTWGFSQLMSASSSGSLSAQPNGTNTSAYSAKEFLLPVCWARLISNSSDSFKGVSSVIRWAYPSHNLGDTYSAVTSRDKIILNDFALPWDGSIPTV